MALWILVANSSFAEIYSLNGKELNRVHIFDCPEGRQKGGEVYSDRPGRSFNRPGKGVSSTGAGTARHSYSSETDFHTHEQQLFAHRIAEVLHKEKSSNHFDQLDIIAPPQFLGDLRKSLSESVKKTVSKEINKEISQNLSEHERIDWVRKFLELPRPTTSQI